MNLPVRKKQPHEVFTFRISTKMRKTLNKVAQDNKSTPSEVARYALKTLLQDE